jgi:hypothetical protein
VSFFEPLPEPDDEDAEGDGEGVEYRPPVYRAAPQTVVPGAVGLRVMLVQTPDVAVWLHDFAATLDGVAFQLTAARRDVVEDTDPFHTPHRTRLRFGVAFADGRKAGHDFLWGADLKGDAATEIALTSPGGGGGSTRWTEDKWLWPLPPDGPVTFAVQWPEVGIAETTVEIDAAPLREAAAQAIELWEDPRPPLPTEPKKLRGWSAYGSV